MLDGNLYTVETTKLSCLDMNTGDIKWTQKGLGNGTLLIANGKLIILGEQGELILAEASPTAYKELARAQIFGPNCWTVPVLAGGLLYCRNSRGDAVCLDLRVK